MQASPTSSSTIKLTKTSTTITPNTTIQKGFNQQQQQQLTTTTSSTTTTTAGGILKLTKSTKTSLTNKKTSQSSLDTETNTSKEIEEISKKISEHADAIYRTWKCQGLAPTEIWNLYANAATTAIEQQQQQPDLVRQATDIFGGSVEAATAVSTTEGLQKLVSQFVIKDKEQRGVKATSSTVSYGQRTEASTPIASTKIMPENIGNKMTQKSASTAGATSSGIGGTLKQSTIKTSGIQKPTATKTNTTSSGIMLKSGNSNENSSVKKLAKSTGIATSKSASPTTQNLSSLSSSSSSSVSTLSTLSSSTSPSTNTTTPTTTPTNTIKNNACVKNVVNSAQQQQQQRTSKSLTTATTSPTATTTKTTTKHTLVKGNSAPTIDINLNLDLGFDGLQLDVNSLSQMQTENLLKIQELLQENATQEPKKTLTTTTTTTTKIANKIKRSKSPGTLLESTTTTDSPIVTKTKLTKTFNENHQKSSTSNINNNKNNNDNEISVKKIAKNLKSNNSNNNNNNNNIISTPSSISDKNNSSGSINISNINNIVLNNGNDCVGVEINDAAISKLINTNDSTSDLNTQRHTTATSAKSTTTTGSTAAKTTKSNTIATTTKNTIAKTTIPTTTTTTTTTTTNNDVKVNQSPTQAAIAAENVVSSVKTVDHQSIKALARSGGNSNSTNVDGISVKKQPQVLNENVAALQLTAQKSPSTTTTTVKKSSPTTTITTKENKINESKVKSNSFVNSSGVKNNNSKATPVAATKKGHPVMEIAQTGNDKENNNNYNNNNNNNSKENGTNNDKNDNGSGDNSNSSNMPAPTKRTAVGPQDKLNRPFLTRGSVAERVLMFEKAPGVRNSFLNIKRPDLDVLPRSLQKVPVKLHATPPGNKPQAEQNSLQKEIRTTRSVYIPRFYFPHGKPQPQIAQERILRGILGAFDSFPNNQVTKDELPQVLKVCGLPFYWRMPIVVFCQQNGNGLVERQRFLEFWKQMNIYCHDAASRFVYIHARGQRFRSYIAPEDLVPLVQDVVDTHPGLAFLKEATEFHSRYVHTVIARIFYSVNRSWSGRITVSELKKSDLLEIINLLEEEDDINQIMAFFSYEHFYVIYCKFWELDKDHDLLINQDDLARHSDHALSTRIVERIFSGCVTRNDNKKNPDDEPKMSYTDFVWFLLSEEDKRTPTAIEYWFRCMDLDGDGLLSMYELEYFYEEQQQRMESIGIETLPFEDCLCQMLDMIKPQQPDAISLGDLKRCRMTHVFFDTFFNLEKYLDHEQRDPFATQRDEYTSDWDRFAAHEYELLISEENG